MDTSGCFQPFTTCGMHRNGDGVLQLDAWTVGVKLLCVMDVVVLKRCAFTNRIVCHACKLYTYTLVDTCASQVWFD